MIHNILAQTARTGINIVPFIILIAYVFIISLVVICLICVARYFSKAGNEQKLIRMELGKMAEEVHLLRQELKEGKISGSSVKSD